MHVHQLGFGVVVSPPPPASSAAELDGIVEVRLASWTASVFLPLSHCTSTITVECRTFHGFRDKLRDEKAAALPVAFTLEAAVADTVMHGLIHPIMDLYSSYGVELEEEEVRLISAGKELTSPLTATSSSQLIADTALLPFAPLLFVYDPQSSFTLDPASSTSPSLTLSPSHLTVSISSDSKCQTQQQASISAAACSVCLPPV